MASKKRKLFCEYGPLAYWLSTQKECLRRDLRDLLSKEKLASTRSADPMPCIVKSHRSVMMRRLQGVDQTLQRNKVTNLRLAAARINGIVIAPGQTFSFWRLVGRPSRRRGYLEGLTIQKGELGRSVGGGLCQLANMIHWLVLHSPLTVTELHHHSDALFPDANRRVPFGTGTSILYKNVDYRFTNNTDRPVQLLLWLEEEDLCGELRAPQPFASRWRIVEEDHHFKREADGCYYRNSNIYRLELDRATGEQRARTLLLRNHSRVMYDPALIPPQEIRK